MVRLGLINTKLEQIVTLRSSGQDSSKLLLRI